jgi:hypothetical protein
MTETATTAFKNPTRWLYSILAATGIAVGIAVVGAVMYLLFAAHSGCCGSTMKAEAPAAHSKDCCADMKGMKMPMENMPSMSAMPSMPMPAPSH